MTQITACIAQINTRNYNDQCKYIKKKLSVISCDISRIIFFKKLHVILYNLPYYLSGLDIKINGKNNYGLIFGMNYMMIVILMMIKVLYK